MFRGDGPIFQFQEDVPNMKTLKTTGPLSAFHVLGRSLQCFSLSDPGDVGVTPPPETRRRVAFRPPRQGQETSLLHTYDLIGCYVA